MVKSSLPLMKNNYNQLSQIKRFKMMALLTVINIAGFIILYLLKIIKPFKYIKICKIYDNRIGEFAGRTDTFLRHIQLKTLETEGILYIGIASSKPCNNQLLQMFKRKLFLIQFPKVRILNMFIEALFDEPLIFNEKQVQSTSYSSLFPSSFPFYSISKSIFYQPLPFNNNEYYEFNNTKRNLCFTDYEENAGKKLLKKMGIGDNDWFVCFHSRDPIYIKYEQKTPDVLNDYRNCDIKNYLKAMEYVTSLGGFAIRMGSSIAEKLPDLGNSRIIDYAKNYRSDFGDIYLSAKCKFFVGASSGLSNIPQIFHIPVVSTNLIPISTPLRKNDLFIIKKIWSIKKKRFLTFSEILDFEYTEKYIFTRLGERYTDAGLKSIENTPEEILGVTKEMNERIDGKFITTDEDDNIQSRFQSLFKPYHLCYGTPVRIGNDFLRRNKELIK